MEVILGLLIVAIAIKLGLGKPLVTAAIALDSEVSTFAAERKVENIARLSNLEIDEKAVKTAIEKIEMLNSIKL